jgi:hypothetical protein
MRPEGTGEARSAIVSLLGICYKEIIFKGASFVINIIFKGEAFGINSILEISLEDMQDTSGSQG